MSQSVLLLSVLGAVVALVTLVTAFWVFRSRDAWLRRIQRVFRRPEKPGVEPGPNHYYKPYWS